MSYPLTIFTSRSILTDKIRITATATRKHVRNVHSTSKTIVAMSDSKSILDTVLEKILPRKLSAGQQQMTFFDETGGIFARMIPFVSKPTIASPTVSEKSSVIFDFAAMDEKQFKSQFGVLNDCVMGGKSEASATLVPGIAVKLGGMTEDQFGGFVSFRNRYFSQPIDLSTYDGVRIRCRGDGQRYKLILHDTDDMFKVGFHQMFDCPRGEAFQDVELSFKDFKAVRRGRLIAANDEEFRSLDASKIMALQVMLSKFAYGMDDKNPLYKPGNFSLEVKKIEAYRKG